MHKRILLNQGWDEQKKAAATGRGSDLIVIRQ